MKKRKQLDKFFFRTRMRLNKDIPFRLYSSGRVNHYIDSSLTNNSVCSGIILLIKSEIEGEE